MPLELIPVSSRKRWGQFIELPWKIYRGDACWVPPLRYELRRQLDTQKNPFFRHAKLKAWLAVENGQPIGRIAAIIDDNHNRHYGERTGFFGYFECAQHPEAAAALLEAAGAWLRENGLYKMTGPINLSTANESGLLIEGFDRPPVIQMTYNPPYYLELLEAAGMQKLIDLLAFYTTDEIVAKKDLIQRLERISNRLTQAEHIDFRSFDPRHYARDLELIRQLYNDFMQDNWGFVPLEKEEFAFSAGLLRPLLVPELALFAEVNGKPVGFSLAVPDVNQTLIKMNGRLLPFGLLKFLWYKRKITDIRVMLMGISAAFRRKGLEAVFYLKTIKDGYYKKGFTGAEMSWVTESNPDMIAALAKLDTHVYKKYRIFSKDLR